MDAQNIADIIIECFNNGNKLLICGNGGSASQAMHFAAEFVSKFEHERVALPAIALTANASTITSIANDFGYKYVFSRQIEALGTGGDVLIVLSTSGKSKNCLEAIKTAPLFGIGVIDFPRQGKAVDEIQNYQLKLMHDVCRIVEKEFI